MNSGVLISGIIGSVATIYAYNKGFSVDSVITKLEENTEVAGDIVRQLYELSLDLLQKIYTFLLKFVEKVIFNIRLKVDDLRLS